MRACDCNIYFANTGTPGCRQLMAVARKLILVPTFDSTGVRNKIASGATINAAYFTAAINNADTTKRWYPTGLIDNIEDARAEPIMETLNSQKKLFVQDGIRSFKGIIVEESNILLGQYEKFMCKDFSTFIIDKESNLIGSYDGTDLYPISIDKDTFYPMLVKTTDTTVQKIQLQFEYSRSEMDKELKMILFAEMAGVNPILLSGLLDVVVTTSSPATTSFKAALALIFGTFKTPMVVTGWLAADFTLYNVTDSASVTILTAVESPNGTYTITYTSQTSGDVLRLTATKNGYEFPATTVTVP